MLAACMPGPWWSLRRCDTARACTLPHPSIHHQKVLEKARDLYSQIEQATLELKVCVMCVVCVVCVV